MDYGQEVGHKVPSCDPLRHSFHTHHWIVVYHISAVTIPQLRLACPPDVQTSNLVEYGAATPSGGTPPYSTVTYVPPPTFNFLPARTTPVIAIVTDSNGLTARCVFRVTLTRKLFNIAVGVK